MIVIHIPHCYQLDDNKSFQFPIDTFSMMTHIQNKFPYEAIGYIEYYPTDKYGEIVVPTKFVGHNVLPLRVNIVPAKVV